MKINIIALLLFYIIASISPVHATEPSQGVVSKEKLGERLFFDPNLSQNRTQSCATCHNPAQGFTDNRSNVVDKAASLGDDGKSLGDRNTPTLAYAKFSPDFHQKKANKRYAGGQFWDGRSKDLMAQAGQPILNPIEMAMPDKAFVVKRLQENPDYVRLFKQLFGDTIFAQTDEAYAAMAESLAAFEKTTLFSPFDSKYDRYLRGEVELTTQEALGESLFFSNQFTNCNRCHQFKTFPNSEGETFSNYEYHNLGVPLNAALRKANGKAVDFVDTGLLLNPAIEAETEAGKFKTPTLRNIAITAPYMHNGIFKDLRTVLAFYDQYNNVNRNTNPETGKPWQAPEVNKNIALHDKEFQAPALKDKEIDALLAFLKTLTDQRYEYLLQE